MNTILRLPVWLYLLIRLAIWNDGVRFERPIIIDPIKRLQDEYDELGSLKSMLLSNFVRECIQHRMEEIAKEIYDLHVLNVAVVGFIPKNKEK